MQRIIQCVKIEPIFKKSTHVRQRKTKRIGAMKMTKFFSTRDKNDQVTGAQAIIKGISDNGGLYVSDKFENLSRVIEQEASYSELCIQILESFFPEIKIDKEIETAYKKFCTDPQARLVKVGEKFVLELYHGPTSAFKDFALVALPHLMKKAKEIENDNSRTVILTATSGDTGKAALEGFAHNKDSCAIENTDIIVLYPKDGVSEIQKRQMITQEGNNVHVIGINGNFDHAQTAVKEIFSDKELTKELLEKNIRFSSANSINIGRLVPQIAYYFQAYKKLISDGEILNGEKVSFCVPTGNFGDILAGYYAKQMGLPVDKLVCASNENNVLVDFFSTGTYNKKRDLKCTASPSMDIVVSSNLERLLYHISGSDKKVSAWMNSLSEIGEYTIYGNGDEEDKKIRKELETFGYGYSDKAQAFKSIKAAFDDYGYLMDPHTAVAWSVSEKYVTKSKMIVLSTASPFKFASSVCDALYLEKGNLNEFELLELLSKKTGCPVPKNLGELVNKRILHKEFVEKEEIKSKIKNILIKDSVKIKVPATTANVGPGFDSIGIAFKMYTQVDMKQHGIALENKHENIELEFENCEEAFANRDNLIYTSYIHAIKKIGGNFPQKLKIKINSDIPICRGLGSSAACIVAGVSGAFELSGKSYTKQEVLEVCNTIEGHPDNIAPAIFGGFKASLQDGEKVYTTDIPVGEELRFFALIPDFKLSTEYARSVLPQEVEFKDAVYNVGRTALMIGAFLNKDYDLLKVAVKDRLHQNYRGKIIKEYDKVMEICDNIGATATFLSGAGPTIMVIDQNGKNDKIKYEENLSKLKEGWKVHELAIDFEGTTLE